MFSVITPGSQSISELAATVEFVKLITSTDGLKQTLDQLAADKKAIEEGTANLNNTLSSFADREAKIVEAETEINKRLDAADGVLKKATEKMDLASSQMATTVQAGQDLDQRITDFNTAQTKAQNINQRANDALQERENTCAAWETRLNAMKTEYEDKLAALKGIVA